MPRSACPNRMYSLTSSSLPESTRMLEDVFVRIAPTTLGKVMKPKTAGAAITTRGLSWFFISETDDPSRSNDVRAASTFRRRSQGRYMEVKAFTAGVVALSVAFGGYATEVFRGAIAAVPIGQTEAAKSLGLKAWQGWTLVIVPQMLRVAFASLRKSLDFALQGHSIGLGRRSVRCASRSSVLDRVGQPIRGDFFDAD